MKIHFLTRYGPLAPSSRLRAYQFGGVLRDHGHDCSFYPLLSDAYVRELYSGSRKPYGSSLWAYMRRAWHLRAAVSDCDVAVVEKELFPWLPSQVARTIIGPTSTPILVDYDDAVYLNYVGLPLLRQKIDDVMSLAWGVIAGNHTIERYARAFNARVFYLPTVIDTRRYTPVDATRKRRQLVIGWIGTPVTEGLLKPLIPVWERIARIGDVKLLLVGARPGFRVPGIETQVVEWREDTEVDLLREMDIGIMPLEDNEWNRGKCGYKLIQYMGAGLPTIASPVGANMDIVVAGVTGFLAQTVTDWAEAFVRLLGDAQLRHAMGRAGRRRVEERFSLVTAGDELSRILGSANAPDGEPQRGGTTVRADA